MDVDKETETQIQELQVLEQNLQGILMQKQSVQLELTELENALSELAKSDSDVYKVVGQIMVASKKEGLEKELAEKKDLVEIRTKSLDKQEETLSKNAEELREKVLGKIKEK